MMNKAIYFKSETCAICRDLLPKVENHFRAHYPQLPFEIIDIEKKGEVAAQYHVFAAPVLLIFFEDKEHFRLVRNFSLYEIDAKLERTYNLMFQ